MKMGEYHNGFCEHVSLDPKDTVWVVVNRLTKSTHFIPINKTNSLEILGRAYVREIIRLHGVPLSIVSDRDLYFMGQF